jgi:hypothetical protein
MKQYCAGDQAIYNYFVSFEKNENGRYHVTEDEGSIYLERTYDAPTKKEFLQQMFEEHTKSRVAQSILDILQDAIDDTPEGI